MKKTRVEKLTELYVHATDTEGCHIAPSTGAVRKCLGIPHPPAKPGSVAVRMWRDRCNSMAGHAYSRRRDLYRALHVADFALARALDAAAQTGGAR